MGWFNSSCFGCCSSHKYLARGVALFVHFICGVLLVEAGLYLVARVGVFVVGFVLLMCGVLLVEAGLYQVARVVVFVVGACLSSVGCPLPSVKVLHYTADVWMTTYASNKRSFRYSYPSSPSSPSLPGGE